MKFSYEMLPEQPVPELLEIVDLLDKLGFYACYSADETYHKDMWQMFAVAATRTKNVRLGPDVTHVIIKDLPSSPSRSPPWTSSLAAGPRRLSP